MDRGLPERAAGAEPIEIPAIAIVPPHSYAHIDGAIAGLKEFDWVVFTSANAVRVFCERALYAGVHPAAAGLQIDRQQMWPPVSLDDVELPLYTTCSRLISTSGDFREAAVSSALNWIGDLGGSWITKALRLFFIGPDRQRSVESPWAASSLTPSSGPSAS